MSQQCNSCGKAWQLAEMIKTDMMLSLYPVDSRASFCPYCGVDLATGLDYHHTDTQGRTWHVTERDDGSVVVYYTRPDDSAQYVVFDTLDAEG